MPRTPKRREESGFILLASILVISLLTIVLVSSQQSAASYQSQQIAQQNALFGLSQALGQLQCGFAYWVSDEGIKAKTNIPDPYLGSNLSTPVGYLASAAHFMAAQSPAVNQSLTLDASGNSLGAPTPWASF